MNIIFGMYHIYSPNKYIYELINIFYDWLSCNNVHLNIFIIFQRQSNKNSVQKRNVCLVVTVTNTAVYVYTVEMSKLDKYYYKFNFIYIFVTFVNLTNAKFLKTNIQRSWGVNMLMVTVYYITYKIFVVFDQ